jgi:hypothetical protein
MIRMALSVTTPTNTTYYINTSSMYFTKGVEYEVSAYLYNSSSIDDVTNIPQFDFYLTRSLSGGQFPFELWESDSRGFRIGMASLQKQSNFNISRLIDDSTINGTTTDYQYAGTTQVIPKYSTVFFSQNFIPDYDGTASLLIYPRYGSWYISDISVKPFQTDNYNCSEFEIKVQY